MKTVKFHKTECGVEVLLNVLHGDTLSEKYLERDTYNTDFFEILLFKKAKGSLVLNQQKILLKTTPLFLFHLFKKGNGRWRKKDWILQF